MLTIIDGGCYQHPFGEFKITGVAAELIGDILRNLPRTGGYHIFICRHGFTHHMLYHVTQDEISADVMDVPCYYVVN